MIRSLNHTHATAGSTGTTTAGIANLETARIPGRLPAAQDRPNKATAAKAPAKVVSFTSEASEPRIAAAKSQEARPPCRAITAAAR